jgi:hypothetical protein
MINPVWIEYFLDLPSMLSNIFIITFEIDCLQKQPFQGWEIVCDANGPGLFRCGRNNPGLINRTTVRFQVPANVGIHA